MGLSPTGSAGVSQAVVDAALLLKLDAQTAATQVARLALTGLTRGARVYQTDNGFWYELTNAAAPSDAASWQGIPKKYVALLTQTGTDAPVATVLENSLGGTVVWTRTDPGAYLGTLADAFSANAFTSWNLVVSNVETTLPNVSFIRTSANVVSSFAGSGEGGDDWNNLFSGKVSLTILVYP